MGASRAKEIPELSTEHVLASANITSGAVFSPCPAIAYAAGLQQVPHHDKLKPAAVLFVITAAEWPLRTALRSLFGAGLTALWWQSNPVSGIGLGFEDGSFYYVTWKDFSIETGVQIVCVTDVQDALGAAFDA